MESCLWDAARDGDLQTLVELLYQKGLDPDVADSDGWTALHFHFATVDFFEEDRALLETLLNAGADPNAKNNYGETPIFFANDAVSAQLLLEAGAKLMNETDNDGDNPLHSACSEGRTDMVRFLILEAGGKMLVNVQNGVGNTPLHHAVQSGSQDTVQVLLEHGCADPTILNDDCQSAMDLAREANVVRINPVYKVKKMDY